MKKLLFLLLLVSTSVFAQKVEHGMLVGATLSIPMQDNSKIESEDDFGYNHDLQGGGMIGYRFRFLPERKSFFDLDVTIGFQGMGTYKYSPFYNSVGEDNSSAVSLGGEHFSEFIMPISITASYNYRITDKFHVGLGVAPTLYAQPQAAFDFGILAKIGYRVLPRCEVGLSYQYGCLDVLKHFNDGPALGRRGHLSDLMLSVYVPFSLK